MGRQGTKKITGSDDEDADMSLWAHKLIQRFDSYSCNLLSILTASFDRIFALVSKIQETQNKVLVKLSELAQIGYQSVKISVQKSLICSTIVKIKRTSRKSIRNAHDNMGRYR